MLAMTAMRRSSGRGGAYYSALVAAPRDAEPPGPESEELAPEPAGHEHGKVPLLPVEPSSAYDEVAAEARAPRARTSRVARNTAVFAIATGLSRLAGLMREIIAARYFGTSGPISAFTIAFAVPNVVR